MNTWFITGASSGFGLELTRLLLEGGYQVAATSRNKDRLTQEVTKTLGNNTKSKEILDKKFLALAVDLQSPVSVEKAFKDTVSKFKSIEVLVNNAGYAQNGAFEEVSDKEMRANLEVNLFAVMNVCRVAIPYLRETAKRLKVVPKIFNISSIAGFAGLSGIGAYSISKFALDGLTETLGFELRAFGIKVCSVRPGFFRTNFMNASTLLPEKQLDIYEDLHQAFNAFMENVKGNEPGDPVKAMQLLIKVAQENSPPLYLFLGSDSYDTASKKLNQIQKCLDRYKSEAAEALNFPDSKL
ncbi:short-chain dehydrogenase/reductase (SDR) family protein [Tieghemostelium lacteum]|uniref:Short-chain dehydrogenase/reductase (SDR) family protein n=1 Tax=Tieghemostelium lacteum TaxID=361077 RepID=A0A151ZHI1_TIELA|nr:short-chain dehydrogenase/reductase (SDR) family protein [Tieghemostelium lacteum]|eukprot:KYQ93441.1 short-chain dehydrogenase/reductase (SDR) family protein [Tieghemostelium lacteum]